MSINVETPCTSCSLGSDLKDDGCEYYDETKPRNCAYSDTLGVCVRDINEDMKHIYNVCARELRSIEHLHPLENLTFENGRVYGLQYAYHYIQKVIAKRSGDTEI